MRRRRRSRRGRSFSDFACGTLVSVTEHSLKGLGSVAVGCGRASWQAGRLAFAKLRSKGEHQAVNPCGGPKREEGGEPTFVPIADKPDTCFADVAGLEDVKESVQVRMLLPFAYPELADLYGVRAGGGVLLFGPPGNGKTLIARATAHELDAVIFVVTPASIMRGTVGQAEANVESLFQEARQYPRAMIFVDEIESLTPARRRNGSTIAQRVTSAFLQQLDGFTCHRDRTVLFMGATNELSMVDPAMLRAGRFDCIIEVKLPNLLARRQILERSLGSRPVDAGVDLDRLAIETEGMSGAALRGLVDQAAGQAFLDSVNGHERPINRQDFELSEWGRSTETNGS